MFALPPALHADCVDLLHSHSCSKSQVLEGPLADAIPLPADRLQLRAAALMRAGDLPAAAACYRQALSAEPDDWLSWQLFLDCSLPGSSGGQGSGAAGARFSVGVVGGLADIWDRKQPAAVLLAGQEAATAVAAVEEALAALQAEVAASEAWSSAAKRGTLRAPHLWRCELLLRRLRLAGAAGDSAQQAALRRQLGAAAAGAFGSLAGNFSCVADLRPYLAQLAGEDAEQLAAAAHRLAAEANAAEEAAPNSGGSGGSGGNEAGKAVGNGDSAPAAPGAAPGGGSGSGASGEIRRLQRQVSALSLEAELGLPQLSSASEAATYARRLLELYRSHMHLSGALGRGGGLGWWGWVVCSELGSARIRGCRVAWQMWCLTETRLCYVLKPVTLTVPCSFPGREGARLWRGSGRTGCRRPGARRGGGRSCRCRPADWTAAAGEGGSVHSIHSVRRLVHSVLGLVHAVLDRFCRWAGVLLGLHGWAGGEERTGGFRPANRARASHPSTSRPLRSYKTREAKH